MTITVSLPFLANWKVVPKGITTLYLDFTNTHVPTIFSALVAGFLPSAWAAPDSTTQAANVSRAFIDLFLLGRRPPTPRHPAWPERTTSSVPAGQGSTKPTPPP